MKRLMLAGVLLCCSVVLSAVLLSARSSAAGAPASPEVKNPFAGNAAAIKEGEKIFDDRCSECHGSDAMGGAGPDLTDDRWIYGGSDAAVFFTVSGGRKGGMPSWQGQIRDEDIWKVIAYVRSLSKK